MATKKTRRHFTPEYKAEVVRLVRGGTVGMMRTSFSTLLNIGRQGRSVDQHGIVCAIEGTLPNDNLK
jgi:hypothetical protein